LATTEAPERVPALYNHCVRTYEEMLSQSKKAQLDGYADAIVWEGFLTDLIQGQLAFSSPYYTSIMQALTGMGCVRQLRRGGSTTESQWILEHDPSLEDFLEYKEATATPKPSPLDPLLQQLRDLTRRIERLEDATGLAGLPLPQGTTPPGGIEVTGVEG
jgi:hypothetical protein